MAVGCIKGVSTRELSPQNLIWNHQNDGKAVPRWPKLSALGFCITFFAFSVFWQLRLAQVMERVIPYRKHCSNSDLLSITSVQILWMLTDFWSLIVTPVDTDQLLNALLFDKSQRGSN